MGTCTLVSLGERTLVVVAGRWLLFSLFLFALHCVLDWRRVSLLQASHDLDFVGR